MEIIIQSKKHGNKTVLINKEDFEKINSYNWHINYNHGNYYVETNLYVNGKRRTKGIHSFIKECPIDLKIDHINGDALDNRKENLRICTNQENCRNQRKTKLKRSSKYKGVSYNKNNRNYRAYIKHDGKHVNIGSFLNENDAAEAYNKKAFELFGEFANLNIIDNLC